MRARRDIKTRFFEKVEMIPFHECWEWSGWKDNFGYGRMSVHGTKAHTAVASRLSWEIHYGGLSSADCVLHKCDNPGCVNPGHLFVGSRKDNNLDMCNKNRNAKAEKNGRAILNREQVIKIREVYSSGIVTQSTLASEYKVSRIAISKIVTGKNWSNI